MNNYLFCVKINSLEEHLVLFKLLDKYFIISNLKGYWNRTANKQYQAVYSIYPSVNNKGFMWNYNRLTKGERTVIESPKEFISLLRKHINKNLIKTNIKDKLK